MNEWNLEIFPIETHRKIVKHTFAVLNATFWQSGRMLTDHAGKWNGLPLKVTVASDWSSMLARKAAHLPDDVL